MEKYYLEAHGEDGNVFINHNGYKFNRLDCELQKWNDDKADIIVAELDNKLIGFLVSVSPYKEIFWIRATYTEKEYRKLGLHYLMAEKYYKNGAKVWFYQTNKCVSEKMIETSKRRKLSDNDGVCMWIEEI